MQLFHGTTIKRMNEMNVDGFIKPAEIGEAHISLTLHPGIAAYFAMNSFSDDNELEQGTVVLVTTSAALKRLEIDLFRFSSPVWGVGECDWEQEVATRQRIPMSAMQLYSITGPVIGPNSIGIKAHG